MPHSVDKVQASKSLSPASEISQRKEHNHESSNDFIDNRPEVLIQKKIQSLANTSPQVQKTIQLQVLANQHLNASPIQKMQNKTGLPDNLKSGLENLSGYSMDDVKVHYNSSKPAQLQAHAYAQGTNIHIAPGQEKHLAHEAWHVIQQKQGRVKPTVQLNNLNINDSPSLEKEADVMGMKAIQMKKTTGQVTNQIKKTSTKGQAEPIQMVIGVLRNHVQHQTMVFSNNQWYFIQGGTHLAPGTVVDFDIIPNGPNPPPGIHWARNVRPLLNRYRFNNPVNRLQSITNFFGPTRPYAHIQPYRIDRGTIGARGFGSIPVRWRLTGLDGAHALGFNIHVFNEAGRTGPGAIWLSGIDGGFNNEDIHVNWGAVIAFLLTNPAVQAEYVRLKQLFASRKKSDNSKWASIGSFRKGGGKDKDNGGGKGDAKV